MGKERYLNTSLAKALRVLDLFNGVENGLSLSEIAQRLGLRPGSIYPIVYTLSKFGYLERDAETKKYALGLRILVLANQILSSLDIREKAKPILKRLARDLEVNVHLAVLYEGEVLYLDREEASPSVIIPSVIGRRVPPHCTALGKVLLAHNPEAVEKLLGKGSLPAFTPNTITNPDFLRQELKRVWEQGYSVDWEEFHQGNICVAAPVYNYRGKVVAAISLSFPKARLTHEPLNHFVQAVVQGARELSASLGYQR